MLCWYKGLQLFANIYKEYSKWHRSFQKDLKKVSHGNSFYSVDEFINFKE